MDVNTIKIKIHSFIDSIFTPPISLLQMARDKLNEVGMVTAQGLNVNSYLSIFGDIPYLWQVVIKSLLASIVILLSVFIFRSAMRIYYAVKEGVKWW